MKKDVTMMNDSITAEMIAISFIEKIINSDELMDKLIDYDNNIDVFSDKFSKEEYLNGIGSFLTSSLFSPANEKETEILLQNLKRYTEKVIQPNFLKDRTSVYANKVMLALATRKTQLLHIRDRNKNIDTILKEPFVIDLVEIVTVITDEIEQKLYKSAYNNCNDEELRKLFNYYNLTDDKELLLNLFYNNNDSNKEKMLSFFAHDNLFDIKNLNSDFLNENPYFTSLLLGLSVNITHFEKVGKKRDEQSFYEGLYDRVLNTDDETKVKILSSPIYNRPDSSTATTIYRSIEDPYLRAKVIEIISGKDLDLERLDYAGLIEWADWEEVARHFTSIINEFKETKKEITKRDEEFLLACACGINHDYLKSVLFEQIIEVMPHLVDKKVIYDFYNSINDIDSLKNKLLDKDVADRLNIFDVIFILNGTVLSDDSKKNILKQPIILEKLKEYNIPEVDYNKNFYEICEDFKNEYCRLVNNGIKNKELDVDLLNSVNLGFFTRLNFPINGENIKNVIASLLTEENRNTALLKPTMEYIFERFVEELSQEQKTPCFCKVVTDHYFSLENTYGDYRHRDYPTKLIRLNRKYIKDTMAGNIPIFTTCFHEIRHAKQYADMEKNDNNFEMLRMTKDNILTLELDKQKDEPSTGYYLENYYHCSTESDARCIAMVDTIKFLKEVAPDIGENLKDKNIRSLTADVKIKKFPTRSVESNKVVLDLDAIFDVYVPNKKVVEYIEKYPVLLKEYHADGTKKNIVELLEAKENCDLALGELNVTKKDVRKHKDLLDPYLNIKKDYVFYDKLINHKKEMTLTNDLLLPSCNLKEKFDNWDLLADYNPDNPRLEQARDEYMMYSLKAYERYQELAGVKQADNLNDKITTIYKKTANNFVAAGLDGNRVQKKEQYEINDIINLIIVKKMYYEYENIQELGRTR